MTDSVERFSDRVANYIKYRPDYPREVRTYLAENCGLTHETVIADIGCGTGISSALFLENCNQVFGVEPVGHLGNLRTSRAFTQSRHHS